MELQTKLRTGLCLCERNAGTNSRTRLWVEGNKGKEKMKMKGEGEDEREGFSGSLDKSEFNISKVQRSLYIWNSTFRKVQRSLNVWNLTFRRFTPASTLALDI
ncbi:unnamed protein product [Rhizophagus irregularis]|nr:unnamed protein product [Rhizophagus irregularis]